MTWNIPNALTLLRFALVPVFLVFILQETFTARLVSLLVFAVAALTDMLDGILARRWNQKSEFGKFADPLADKCLVAAALIAFLQLPETLVPFWLVFLILAREFLVTGLRVTALSRNESVDVSYLGKAKTASQMVTILVVLVLLIWRAWLLEHGYTETEPGNVWRLWAGSEGWADALRYTPLALVTVTAFLTVLSGVRYFVKNWKLLFRG